MQRRGSGKSPSRRWHPDDDTLRLDLRREALRIERVVHPGSVVGTDGTPTPSKLRCIYKHSSPTTPTPWAVAGDHILHQTWKYIDIAPKFGFDGVLQHHPAPDSQFESWVRDISVVGTADQVVERIHDYADRVEGISTSQRLLGPTRRPSATTSVTGCSRSIRSG
jgi:hypothetical protein